MKKILVLTLLLSCTVAVAQVKRDTMALAMGQAMNLLHTDPNKAFKLYSLYADQGNAAAMNALGVLYSKGMGTQMNEQLALQWFERSGKAGFAKGWYNLGEMYKYGLGVTQDFIQANKYYKMCADAGLPIAYARLGYMTYKGLGCEQDYKKAYQLLLRSVAGQDEEGMYLLGLCYRNGYGVDVNIDSANYWLVSSAKAGYRPAKEELSESKPENSYIPQPFNFPNVFYDQSKAVSAKLDSGFPKIKHKLPKQNIAGEYEGYLVRFDWSGKHIIGQSKLKLTLLQTANSLKGNWIENDTISTPLDATSADTSIIFNNTGYNTFDHYNHNTANEILFKNATLQLTKNNDDILITGNLRVYSVNHKEPEKPSYIILTKVGLAKNGNLGDENKPNSTFKTDSIAFMAYPNPFLGRLTLQFSLKKQQPVSFVISNLQTAGIIYKSGQEQLSEGVHSKVIDVNGPPGTYVITLKYGDKVKSAVVFKQ